jgi:hypothetical protein
MRRAYLDMNRTLHGMNKFGKDHPGWKSSMLALLRSRLIMLPGEHHWSTLSFDSWHEESVKELKRVSSELGFPSFSVGQSQKWVNMSIKYAIALSERRVPGFYRIYDFAHVALDIDVLGGLYKRGMPHYFTCPWSRLDDYGQYMNCQQWVRNNCKEACPLEVEYRLWQNGPLMAGETEHKDENE